MDQPQKSGPVTFYVDKNLWATFKAVCGKNPRIGSASQELAKLMRSMIETKGRRYGIKPPTRP